MARDNYVQIYSVPRRVARMNDLIRSVTNDPRKLMISSSCFKGLLFVRHQIVRTEAIVYLISKWNIARECFVLPDGREWAIKDEDVARVYGLPYGFGKAPISTELDDSEYAFADELLVKYNIQEKLVKESVMKQLLMSEELSHEDNSHDFWRFYVLYALSSLLIPNSTPGISYRYLKFLEIPMMASGFNWAALVKDKLVDGLNSYKAKIESQSAPTARPNGDMHCLMHLFYDFLDSKNLSERSFTCSLKRSIRLKDVKSVFEPPTCGDSVGSTCRHVIDNGKKNVLPENDEVKNDEVELQFHKMKDKYEKGIIMYDAMLSKYTKRKKEYEDALAKLVLKHELRKKIVSEHQVVVVKAEEVTEQPSYMEHIQRKRPAQMSDTLMPVQKKCGGQSKSLGGEDSGVSSNSKNDDAAESIAEKGKLNEGQVEGRYIMGCPHLVKNEKDW